MIRYWLIILLFLISGNAFSQIFEVSGKVVDEETREPLAFVSLVVKGSRQGCYSDIDGKFKISSSSKIEALKATYVGYQAGEIRVGSKTSGLQITLQKTFIELPEVIILPRENPANRIILNAIENREINDPEKLRSFSYTAYEKLIFTSDLDSVSHIDTLTTDSSMIRAKEFFDNQYFALIENIVQRSFTSPDKSLQKVIATKISGLNDPIFVFLLSQLQPVSFYQEFIKIGENRLVNPVSRGSTSKYFFLIKDTIFSSETRDTTFVIYFRPYKGTNFDGMTGLLYITSDKWAIKNVTAKPYREDNALGIRIQQMYEKVDGEHWFPVQLNTEILFKGIEIYGGKDSTKRSFHLIGKGKSYLKDIVINGLVNKKSFSQVEIYIDPNAARREDNYWDQFRVDSLNSREKRTYFFMDSLGKAENFDKITRNIETLITGKLPLGYVDMNIDKIFRYNDFEGLCLGLGLTTSKRLVEAASLGGYWGYGLHDQTAKYGGLLSIHPLPANDFEVKFSYKYDVRESGTVNWFEEDKAVLNERFRNLLITRMDYEESQKASLYFRTLKYWKLCFAVEQKSRKTGYPYLFTEEKFQTIPSFSTYSFSNLIAGFKFAYKEKFIRNARTQISMGTPYPIVWFQFTKGLKSTLGGQFIYDRVDIKITKTVYYKYMGKTALTLNLGWINGDVPYNELFSGKASYRQFSIYTANSFSTMRMNEFTSDRYIAFFLTHDFGKLLTGHKQFDPDIAIATNVAFGDLRKKDVHRLVEINTMEKGYYESGILINNIFKMGITSMGFGGFYRYGPYSRPDWVDNVSLKVSFEFPF